VPAGELAAFFIGTSAVLTLAGAVLALAIGLHTVRWAGVAAALRAGRRRPVATEA
jgi:hypothetical protein